MIFLYIISLAGVPSFRADPVIIRNNASRMTVDITFTAAAEENYYTRFILSPIPPEISYDIVAGDTLCDPSIAGGSAAPATVGASLKIGTYNAYPVIMKPVIDRSGFRVMIREIRLQLRFGSYPEPKLAPALAAAYQALILNYEYNPAAKPQGLLIITPNSFYNAVLPLADWKEKKGWKVTVATLSQTGNTTAAIKNYIADAYHNWTPPPEYVILVGDKDSLPAFSLNANPTDHPYTTLDPGDFFSELLVGRLSVANVNDLNTVVAKILGYEKNPYTTDTAWYKRGLMVGANYPSNMTTPVPMKRWVREKMLAHGFNQIDTVYYPPVSNGVALITNAVNQGVSFVNYRGGLATWGGWDYPSFYNADVQGLANGWKLPVVTSIVCLTGNFNAEPCFGESWLRAGNPVTPKGAVGFFGATPPTTHSPWNNCLDAGMYWGLLEENIHYFGPMTYRGKLEVYANFPLETSPDSGSEFYFNAYNLLGDPSLEIWTGVPQNLNVSHAALIPTGTNNFIVQVLDASSQPVSGALVSLYKRGEVKALEFTDAVGQVTQQFTTTTPDTLFVTVTKHDYKPYCGFAMVNDAAVYVGYYSHIINDSSGNNNAEINPGETILMPVTLKNFGTSSSADNVTGKLTCPDPLITITDSLQSYGSIGPGATATSAPYAFNVSQYIKNEHLLRFNLGITSNQGNWNSALYLTAKASEFAYLSNQILDGGNGILEPGESSDLTVWIKNTGGLAGANIAGTLRSRNPAVTVVDSNGLYGTIATGDSTANGSDHFRVSAAANLAPGHKIDFILLLNGDTNFTDTLFFSLVIGIVTTTTPLGPDGYGYYAYDNTDAGYPEAPAYSWVEIDPGFGGLGTELPLANDETKTIGLPFTFQYYGSIYSRVSVCSNGFIALDSTWIADMYNWHIPAALGPPLLVAAFWDDLDPNATDSSRAVYYYSDAANHRLIIEYSRVQHIHNPTNPTPAELETFEALLYDPAYYPTLTGDGEIVFQYFRINNDDGWHNFATCGIENFGHTDGIEYTFADIYPAAAAPLADGRAIKFTTDPPDPYPGVREADRMAGRGILLNAYPNPSRSRINIRIGQSAPLRGSGAPFQDFQTKGIALNIYNITGRLVKSFTFPSALSPMPYALCWNGTDQSGRAVPAGVYFATLEAGKHKFVQKLVLIR
jgi:hypothetical protein